ncbi:MAG TPA: ribosome recycling factor [Spirochaetota bacterium]|nr:ribosome recycling factor [Spirochaetota bacterium]HOS32808.1 ribosome recycling factor [Spirochaetota bacterium]HOS55713.1 ribosome recycling factor [Spirochaetota bacterium]HPK61516.1 ribosome recycling factor [Spirochaetota bacterium]HQF78324.1 ribosome recycling factor [Spirochaetota bacterium]
MLNGVKESFDDKAKKSIASFQEQLKKIRTGRASAAILDGVMVDYYGTPTPIDQTASISIPEARLILIQPWDKTTIKNIEKAIQKAELGFNPSNDGNVIRIVIPPLTEETRLELVKNAKAVGEQARVSIRNLRRESNESLKKYLKDRAITEDQEKQGLDDIQKSTDDYIKEINSILEKKEKEILEI